MASKKRTYHIFRHDGYDEYTAIQTEKAETPDKALEKSNLPTGKEFIVIADSNMKSIKKVQ